MVSRPRHAEVRKPADRTVFSFKRSSNLNFALSPQHPPKSGLEISSLYSKHYMSTAVITQYAHNPIHGVV